VSNPFRKYDGKIVVITHELCPVCHEFEARVKSSDAKDSFVFLDVTKSDEARMLAKAFDLRETPSLIGVSEDKEGKKLVACLLDSDFNVKRCMEVEAGEPGGAGGEGKQA
jgi:hypothetical protein